jgi:hypothetical protein
MLPVGQNHPLKPGGNDLPKVKHDAPKGALLSPGIWSRQASEQPQWSPSRFRDDSEAWEHWWERGRQDIVDKIDRKVGMNTLLGTPKEHLRNMKMAITTVPYDGANNLLVFNTWLGRALW